MAQFSLQTQGERPHCACWLMIDLVGFLVCGSFLIFLKISWHVWLCQVINAWRHQCMRLSCFWRVLQGEDRMSWGRKQPRSCRAGATQIPSALSGGMGGDALSLWTVDPLSRVTLSLSLSQLSARAVIRMLRTSALSQTGRGRSLCFTEVPVLQCLFFLHIHLLKHLQASQFPNLATVLFLVFFAQFSEFCDCSIDCGSDWSRSFYGRGCKREMHCECGLWQVVMVRSTCGHLFLNRKEVVKLVDSSFTIRLGLGCNFYLWSNDLNWKWVVNFYCALMVSCSIQHLNSSST